MSRLTSSLPCRKISWFVGNEPPERPNSPAISAGHSLIEDTFNRLENSKKEACVRHRDEHPLPQIGSVRRDINLQLTFDNSTAIIIQASRPPEARITRVGVHAASQRVVRGSSLRTCRLVPFHCASSRDGQLSAFGIRARSRPSLVALFCTPTRVFAGLSELERGIDDAGQSHCERPSVAHRPRPALRSYLRRRFLPNLT